MTWNDGDPAQPATLEFGASGDVDTASVVFANVARSHLPASLSALPAGKRSDPGFFVGNMIPVCISDDRAAAAAVSRRTLTFYLTLPNYRNAWREAGYGEEMAAVETALEPVSWAIAAALVVLAVVYVARRWKKVRAEYAILDAVRERGVGP